MLGLRKSSLLKLTSDSRENSCQGGGTGRKEGATITTGEPPTRESSKGGLKEGREKASKEREKMVKAMEGWLKERKASSQISRNPRRDSQEIGGKKEGEEGKGKK